MENHRGAALNEERPCAKCGLASSRNHIWNADVDLCPSCRDVCLEMMNHLMGPPTGRDGEHATGKMGSREAKVVITRALVMTREVREFWSDGEPSGDA